MKRALTLGLVAWTLACAGLALRFAAFPLFRDATAESQAPMSGVAALRHRQARADSLAAVAAARDPFRLARRPAAVPFDPGRADGTPAPAPTPARPIIIVTGVVLGGRPMALLEGIPTIEGARLLGVGERAGMVEVRGIDSAQVVLAVRDTVTIIRVRGATP